MIDLSMYRDNEDCCEKLNELHEENEQSKMMISILRNMVLEQEDLKKEKNGLKAENEQLKSDLKRVLPLILAIDFKISINECKAINRLCELVEDDFIKGKELNKVS